MFDWYIYISENVITEKLIIIFIWGKYSLHYYEKNYVDVSCSIVNFGVTKAITFFKDIYRNHETHIIFNWL